MSGVLDTAWEAVCLEQLLRRERQGLIKGIRGQDPDNCRDITRPGCERPIGKRRAASDRLAAEQVRYQASRRTEPTYICFDRTLMAAGADQGT
jgi:hypothetical protein